MPISEFMIAEKNKLATLNVTLTLLEIAIPDDPGPPIHYTTVRLVDGNTQITWNNSDWLPVPFEWSEFIDSSKGEIPRVDFSISNMDRQMEYYIQAYDLYSKINGYTPVYITIYMVNSGNLNSNIPEIEYLFELQDVRSSAQWVTFTLGASNPYNQRFPLNRMMKNNGRVKRFKDIFCGYPGNEVVCDRTLTMCRAFGNSRRYCGFPGVGNNSIRLSR